MKLSGLGKELRKIRLERMEPLLDMAERLGMSPAMLSGIETGRKPAPEDFVQKLAENYDEVAADLPRFTNLAELTKKSVKVSLEEVRDDAKEAAFEFNRILPHMDAESIQEIREILQRFINSNHESKTK